MQSRLLIVCVAVVGGAYYYFNREQPAPPEPEPIAVVATPATATPIPTPSPFAPPGVFFLAVATNVTTDDGIVGVRAGTRLQETGPGEFQTSGGLKLKLAPEQVTNDLRIAAKLVQHDAALRQALGKWQQDQTATTLEQQRLANEEAARQQEAVRYTSTSAPPQRSGPTALDRGAHSEKKAMRERQLPVRVMEIRNR